MRNPSRGWAVARGEGVCAVRQDRRHDESGAAAVEFALLFPIFAILTMGLIAAGTAFSRQINVTQAAREASRYGATYDITATGSGGTGGTMSTWLDKVETASLQSVGSQTNPLGGFDQLCVALVARDNSGAIDTAHTGYKNYGSSAVTNASTGCPSTATPNLGANSKVVQVVFLRNVKFVALFINPTIHVDAVSVTPYEGVLP